MVDVVVDSPRQSVSLAQQIRLVAGLRWKLLRNKLRKKSNRLDLIGRKHRHWRIGIGHAPQRQLRNGSRSPVAGPLGAALASWFVHAPHQSPGAKTRLSEIRRPRARFYPRRHVGNSNPTKTTDNVAMFILAAPRPRRPARRWETPQDSIYDFRLFVFQCEGRVLVKL